MSRLLTLQEVAGRLRVSRPTVGRLVAAGVLPVVVLAERRRRRLLRIREDSLEQYLRTTERGVIGRVA